MREVNLMELARIIYASDGKMIDFTASKQDEAYPRGGWIGVMRCYYFDCPTTMYLIGAYGVSGSPTIYHMLNPEDEVNDIGRMLVDVFQKTEGGVPPVITVDISDEETRACNRKDVIKIIMEKMEAL